MRVQMVEGSSERQTQLMDLMRGMDIMPEIVSFNGSSVNIDVRGPMSGDALLALISLVFLDLESREMTIQAGEIGCYESDAGQCLEFYWR